MMVQNTGPCFCFGTFSVIRDLWLRTRGRLQGRDLTFNLILLFHEFLKSYRKIYYQLKKVEHSFDRKILKHVIVDNLFPPL